MVCRGREYGRLKSDRCRFDETADTAALTICQKATKILISMNLINQFLHYPSVDGLANGQAHFRFHITWFVR